jgi:hypothetical protein
VGAGALCWAKHNAPSAIVAVKVNITTLFDMRILPGPFLQSHFVAQFFLGLPGIGQQMLATLPLIL